MVCPNNISNISNTSNTSSRHIMWAMHMGVVVMVQNRWVMWGENQRDSRCGISLMIGLVPHETKVQWHGDHQVLMNPSAATLTTTTITSPLTHITVLPTTTTTHSSPSRFPSLPLLQPPSLHSTLAALLQAHSLSLILQLFPPGLCSMT